MRSLAIVALSLAAFAAPLEAVAEMTVGEYKSALRTEPRSVEQWLDGAYSGFSWSSAHLFAIHAPEVFCPPDRLSMTSVQLQSIIDRYIAAENEPDSAWLGAVVLLALRDVFPCNAAE